ncbi:polymeric immunoglobulin receptor [Triplophysa dalaica]|uniref:polymeric immunoglobulin receptor n=1 Tax=Triplophysa dalaica TaxID=1582913 RepID=UPI0024E026B2|nr:polymeric immunoglobulin receptor [Triplophysa dalaica]
MFLKLLTVLVVGHLPGFYCTVTTSGDLTVLEGQSVTVPCHYNPQYTSHVKYWCQGRMREFCTNLARTDDHESAPNGMGQVTIADDPTQHVFTVTMQNLMKGDSGWYWCGVEVGGMWISDSTASLYISVVQGQCVSAVSADEGDRISVHCNYSQNLRSSVKTWCRSGKNEVNGVGGSGLEASDEDPQDSRLPRLPVRLEDDEEGAGGVERPTTPICRSLYRPVLFQFVLKYYSDMCFSHRLLESPWIVCGIVLCCVVIIAFLAIWRFRQQCKKKHRHQETESSELNDKLAMCPWKEDDYKNTSVIFLNTPAHQVHVV